MNLELYLNNIKNTTIPNDSEEGINNYAEEGKNFIKDKEDLKILGSEIKNLSMNQENMVLIEVLMKISEKMKNSKFGNKIKDFLYKKIISQLELNRLDYLYLVVITYTSFEPKIKEVQNILDKSKSWRMYIYLLKYCLNKDNYELDKKYITKCFEIFRDNYKDYDYTPIMSKDLRDLIIKNKEYSEAFSDFILNNADFFNQLVRNRKFEFENLKPFIMVYPEYFGKVLFNIVRIIFENRYYQLSYDIADNVFKECIMQVISNIEIKKGFEILISDKGNWIFDITTFILGAFIEVGYFDVLTNNKFYDHILIEVYYVLSQNVNKQKFYEMNKEIIDKNEKLNIEHKKKNEMHDTERYKKIKKEINSLISPSSIKKMERQGKKLSSKIFKYFLDNQNYFSDKQVEYIKKQIIDFLNSEKTDLKNPEINVVVKQDTEQSRSLTYNNAGFVIDMFDCLRAARFLNIDLSKYGGKIISMLPYSFTNEFKLILTILDEIGIKSITGDDLNWLLDVYYNGAYGDLYKVSPCIFFDLIEKGFIISENITDSQLKLINKLYEKSLNYEFIDSWQMESIIYSMKRFKEIDKELIEQIYTELVNKFTDKNYFEDYLQNKFDREETKDYKKMLALNDVLICNYKDEQAINRRFNQFDQIKTDHQIISDEGEFFRGVTRIEDEFYLSDRSYRKLYEPLIENIYYPEYKDKYFKLFELVDKFNINGMVRPYLYTVLKLYLKNAGVNKLNECLECGDNFFVLNYMKEHLTNEEINKFNNLKKSEQYMKLIEENNCLKRENLFLKKDLEKKGKINLYVEGKTDKKYLEKAMEVLGINLKINIINCGGANNVFTNLSGIIDDKIGGIHIGLLDLDSGGINSWIGSDLENRLFNFSKKIERTQKGYFGNKILENLVNIGGKRSRYSLIFIPRVDDFKNQIFNKGLPYFGEIEGKNQSDFLKKMNVYNGSNFENPIFETEHLVYNENIEEIRDCFEDKYLPGGGQIKVIKDSKKNKLCTKIVNGDIDLPIENWRNFELIFKYIDEIQKSNSFR